MAYGLDWLFATSTSESEWFFCRHVLFFDKRSDHELEAHPRRQCMLSVVKEVKVHVEITEAERCDETIRKEYAGKSTHGVYRKNFQGVALPAEQATAQQASVNGDQKPK